MADNCGPPQTANNCIIFSLGAIAILRHISMALLYGIAVLFTFTACADLIGMMVQLKHGVEAAASGASVLAAAGIGYRVCGFCCSIAPLMAPLTSILRCLLPSPAPPIVLLPLRRPLTSLALSPNTWRWFLFIFLHGQVPLRISCSCTVRNFAYPVLVYYSPILYLVPCSSSFSHRMYIDQ